MSLLTDLLAFSEIPPSRVELRHRSRGFLRSFLTTRPECELRMTKAGLPVVLPVLELGKKYTKDYFDKDTLWLGYQNLFDGFGVAKVQDNGERNPVTASRITKSFSVENETIGFSMNYSVREGKISWLKLGYEINPLTVPGYRRAVFDVYRRPGQTLPHVLAQLSQGHVFEFDWNGFSTNSPNFPDSIGAGIDYEGTLAQLVRMIKKDELSVEDYHSIRNLSYINPREKLILMPREKRLLQ